MLLIRKNFSFKDFIVWGRFLVFRKTSDSPQLFLYMESDIESDMIYSEA